MLLLLIFDLVTAPFCPELSCRSTTGSNEWSHLHELLLMYENIKSCCNLYEESRKIGITGRVELWVNWTGL